jgi:hypothetical protein
MRKQEEIGCDIPGYEHFYSITPDGEVYSKRFKKRMSPMTNTSGYKFVYLWKDRKKKSFCVHKLVATTFLPNLDRKPQVNHLDGNKQNNGHLNLEWVTASENSLHAFRTGLAVSNFGMGKTHISRRKLTTKK